MTDFISSNEAGNGVSREAGVINIADRIEEAYKVFKISEVFLKDVSDDYGKFKIAKLRLDFARYELESLLSQAREKGMKLQLQDKEFLRNLLF